LEALSDAKKGPQKALEKEKSMRGQEKGWTNQKKTTVSGWDAPCQRTSE